jgi:hypothetical protein
MRTDATNLLRPHGLTRRLALAHDVCLVIRARLESGIK